MTAMLRVPLNSSITEQVTIYEIGVDANSLRGQECKCRSVYHG